MHSRFVNIVICFETCLFLRWLRSTNLRNSLLSCNSARSLPSLKTKFSRTLRLKIIYFNAAPGQFKWIFDVSLSPSPRGLKQIGRVRNLIRKRFSRPTYVDIRLKASIPFPNSRLMSVSGRWLHPENSIFGGEKSNTITRTDWLIYLQNASYYFYFALPAPPPGCAADCLMCFWCIVNVKERGVKSKQH